jgi:N-acetylneuraminate synthase
MLFRTNCAIIAEVAQNHDGSLGAAHAYIDAIANAGADAVKFQTHIAAAESSPGEPWRIQFSRQDASRYDYWKRMEFTEEQWAGLAQHAQDRNLIFLSSPFSTDAMELLQRLGMRAWKVGSGEIGNTDLIYRMAKTGKPVLLSSGMSSWAELDRAVATVREAGAPIGIFQCTSLYPCSAEKLGLNVLGEIRKRYQCPVGLSDHSATIFSGLAAVALGAEMIEVHVALSSECFGPDISSSISTSQLRQLCEGVRFIRSALDHPVDKDRLTDDLSVVRAIFTKSVVAARSLGTGHVIASGDLSVRKPGNGIPADRIRELVGRTLRHAVTQNTFLSEEDFD